MSRPKPPTPKLEPPVEVVVYDELEPCPYIDGETARMPLRLQLQRSRERFDMLMDRGDRRVGQMVYRPTCPTCQACVCVRIPTGDFRPTRSQRRVWKLNQDLVVHEHPPRITEARVALFNRHKLERGLGTSPMTPHAYVGWLVNTFADTREQSFWLGDRLVGVSIIDVGSTCSSAVYFYFDPDLADRSLGTFAILYGIEWARRQNLQWHYLGLWVAGNRHLEYKTRFHPQERLCGGVWRRYDREDPAQ
jgi:arginine-tRNA-protein transferase